jgi:flavorubredoxin
MCRRTFAILISVFAVAAFGAGCGDDESSSANSPTKAEFVTKAEKVCTDIERDVRKQLFAASKLAQGSSAKQQEETLVKTIIAPTLNKQADELSALSAPEGDEEQIDAIAEELKDVANEAEKDPTSVSAKADPYHEADKLMRDYGIDACSITG